jgi:hypothetical protein
MVGPSDTLRRSWIPLEIRPWEVGEEGVKTVDEISQEELSRSPYGFRMAENIKMTNRVLNFI